MKKILIVDDSVYQRKILTDLVKEIGYESTAVDSGEEFLQVLDDSYQCIFLDLLMPGMSGIEILRKLQERENVPPVIIITADVQESKKKECLELGARALINKAINREELERTLSTIFK